jgi:hypothetical protein
MDAPANPRLALEVREARRALLHGQVPSGVLGRGLTLVHFSAQRKHFSWNTLAEFSSV